MVRAKKRILAGEDETIIALMIEDTRRARLSGGANSSRSPRSGPFFYRLRPNGIQPEFAALPVLTKPADPKRLQRLLTELTG